MPIPVAPSASPAVAPVHIYPTWRLATSDDDMFVENLQALAFGPGRFVRAAFRIRERFPIDKSLSLIAEIGGRPIASVWMTPISIGGVDGYMLGPLATDPKFRGLGAGKMLVREVCRMAIERKQGSYVMLVGDEPYYGPLGFVRSTPGAIQFPAPVEATRVLVYSPDDDGLATRLKGPVAAFGARRGLRI